MSTLPELKLCKCIYAPEGEEVYGHLEGFALDETYAYIERAHHHSKPIIIFTEDATACFCTLKVFNRCFENVEAKPRKEVTYRRSYLRQPRVDLSGQAYELYKRNIEWAAGLRVPPVPTVHWTPYDWNTWENNRILLSYDNWRNKLIKDWEVEFEKFTSQ